MPVVIGSRSMVGRGWSALMDVTPLDRPALDLTKPSTMELPQDSVIINCAAWTDVDGAEDKEDQARLVNADGVAVLAEQARKQDALLVHYSTDYVFDGQGTSPYPTHHPKNPINAYGRTKDLGEQAIEASGCRHLILRTSWLFAPWGKNFVRTIYRLASERESLTVVDDQRGRPTSVHHLTKVSWQLVQEGAEGIFHVCNGTDGSWFDLAQEIVRIAPFDCEVKPTTTDAFPRPAPRPPYSVLDLSETEKLLGPMAPWASALQHVLKQMDPIQPA